MRKEEIYARQLYEELQVAFEEGGPSQLNPPVTPNKSTEPPVALLLEGAGVHWHCSVSKGKRQCSIHCFDIAFTNLAYKGPEYYTLFRASGHDQAEGRTFDREKTIAAVKDWMENQRLEALYATYAFIDAQKRQLERLRTAILQSNPPIREVVENQVVQEHFNTHSLWFKQEPRGCRVYYYGYEPTPRYVFYWDETILFETTSSDVSRLANLIQEWVVYQRQPSVLKHQFPEVDFGFLADYYEAGKGVEGEFRLSWDQIERFYEQSNLPVKAEVVRLIRQIRAQGFEKTLRAGQSLYTLLVSRSRRHGLRAEQNYIAFAFHPEKAEMEVRTPDGQKRSFHQILYTELIDKLLKQLEQENID